MVNDTTSLPGLALNAEPTVPEWVQLMPAGPRIQGVDGRWWVMANPQAVADRFDPAREPPIDIEHSTQVKGSKGEPAPAAGWIKAIEVRAGALWGRVEWTDLGRHLVADKLYRYLSPVFIWDRTTGEIAKIVSAGLTNEPNLKMTALNRKEETFMDNAVLQALGLPAVSTPADAVAAINALRADRDTARNAAQTPDPAKFVPTADHQLALNRIRTFEEAETARRDGEITVAVDAAIAAGKVAPASKDYHIAACRIDGGLDRFKAFIASAPVVAPPSGLDGKTPNGAEETGAALSAEDLAICRAFGTDPASVAKFKKKDS